VGTGLLIVGQGETNDIEFFVFDIFEERLTQEILHCIGITCGLVHTLNQTKRCVPLAEAGDSSFVLVVFQLLGNLVCIVTLDHINLD
jgi:hypothetical protein